MDVVLAKLSPIAQRTKKKMVHYAILNAKMDIMVSDQSVGRIAQKVSVMMELSAKSLNHMVEVLDP